MVGTERLVSCPYHLTSVFLLMHRRLTYRFQCTGSFYSEILIAIATPGCLVLYM